MGDYLVSLYFTSVYVHGDLVPEVNIYCFVLDLSFVPMCGACGRPEVLL